MNCSRCMVTLHREQPVYLIAQQQLCSACIAKSRYASVTFVARSCVMCARRMRLLPTNRSKHCSGSCRSSMYGLGESRR